MDDEEYLKREIAKGLDDKEKWYRGPLKTIGSLFLVLLMVLWYFSYYGGKIDPSPTRIPTLEEVLPAGLTIENLTREDIQNKYEYRKLLTPNDPEIKLLADRIVSIACKGNKVCHAKAIYYFVQQNFDYVSDPVAFEYIKGPKEALLTGVGDCDDSSSLTANLLEAVGIRTRFVFVPGHVYVEAYLPEAKRGYKSEQDWVGLETTCDNCKFGEVPWDVKRQEKVTV